MNNIRPEDLGSMGESFFNTLCKNVGFVANSSKSDDKGGWDFEVEHRRIKEINYSSQSYPVYRVQVKSTTGKNQTKLTYSNLLKLIQYNGASFIALMKYSNSINPNNVFIFHINENFSKSILEEIRKKQLNLKSFALNKNEKTIKFSNSDKIKPLDGVGLKNSFDKHIGSDYLQYVKNKLKYLSVFEREGQIKQFNWDFKNKKDIKALVNCCLGYDEKFNVDVSEYSAPFGLKDKMPVSTFEAKNTTITPHHDKLPQTTICLKTSKFGKQYEFMGMSYTVPEQLRTFSSTARTKCKLFDLLFDGKTRSLSIQTKDIFTENIEVNFKELYNFLCYINDSIDCDATYINLVNLENQKTAEVCLGAPDFKVPDNFAIIFETICSTYNKLCDLNLENNVFSTKYIWSNIGRFNLFSIVGKEYIPHYVMEFQSHCDYKPEVDVVIFNSVIESTKTNILTFVAFFGSVESAPAGALPGTKPTSNSNELLRRVQDKIFRGSFNKSEWLGDFLFNDSDNREELIELKSQYFKGLLIDRGFKAFY